MSAATISLGIVLTAVLLAAVGLFWVDEPIAGWSALVVGLLGVLSLLGMIVTSARAAED